MLWASEWTILQSITGCYVRKQNVKLCSTYVFCQQEWNDTGGEPSARGYNCATLFLGDKYGDLTLQVGGSPKSETAK
jgi:hypothetical protein